MIGAAEDHRVRELGQTKHYSISCCKLVGGVQTAKLIFASEGPRLELKVAPNIRFWPLSGGACPMSIHREWSSEEVISWKGKQNQSKGTHVQGLWPSGQLLEPSVQWSARQGKTGSS
jgi:hypothetical protein